MNGAPLDQRLAARLAKTLERVPLTPNLITALSLLAGLGAAVLFAHGRYLTSCWAGGLFVLASFLDHLDGEFARLTGQTSRFGHYFDRVTAGLVYSTTFAGIGIGAMQGPLQGLALVLGVAAGVAIAGIFTLRNAVELKHGSSAIRQPVAFGFEIEDTLYLIGPVAWLGGLTPLLVAAGVGAPAYCLFTLLRSRKGRA